MYFGAFIIWERNRNWKGGGLFCRPKSPRHSCSAPAPTSWLHRCLRRCPAPAGPHRRRSGTRRLFYVHTQTWTIYQNPRWWFLFFVNQKIFKQMSEHGGNRKANLKRRLAEPADTPRRGGPAARGARAFHPLCSGLGIPVDCWS